GEAVDKPTKIETTQITIDSTDIDICRDKSHCPKVALDYVAIKGTSAFSDSVNVRNAEDLIELFTVTQEEKSQAQTVAAAVNGFAEEYFKFKADYPASNEFYEADVTQEIKSKTEKLLVLKTSFYIFTGGAHGYS